MLTQWEVSPFVALQQLQQRLLLLGVEVLLHACE